MSSSKDAGKATAHESGLPFAGSMTPARAVVLVVLFLLGALIGIAGALLQGGWFPGGLLLALLGTAGLFHGGARLTGNRSGALAPAAGWLVAVILLTTTRPEGDFVFGAGVGSYLFLLGGMAVAVICATLGLAQQPPASTARLGK